MEIENFERGSEWRQWDLHIHTPASFHWEGEKFDSHMLPEEKNKLLDQMISALNNAEPQVFALMDYWTFDGWLMLKQRLNDSDAPRLDKTVFPGIELRLAAPTNCRLNAHVIFSNLVSDQELQDFKSKLSVEIINRPLSNDSLVQLARMVGEDKLKLHGFNNENVLRDDRIALIAGSTIAEINCDSYKDAIANVPDGKAIGFMPYDTNDGLAEVKWQDNYAYFLGLFKSSPIFESRNLNLRLAFIGEKNSQNQAWIDNFQKDLGNIPRLVVAGSDAHRFTGVSGENNKRGYGDFPSGKKTWIKADPTFLGLQQAIKEPAKRSFIGDKPQKLQDVDKNKIFYIDTIKIQKVNGSQLQDEWLNNCEIMLNSGLVAIIGNKGSGKSALADIIASLGNSRQKAHFTFLKKDRFRGKSGEPARQFEGSLRWMDGGENKLNLNDDPQEDQVELIRYIPQGHFEELCNGHVSGKSEAFEKELRSVIFSHLDRSITQGALDFDQLIEQQEINFRDDLEEYRKDLKRLNDDIFAIEEKLQPEIRRSLEESLKVKEKQIEEHFKNCPIELRKPSEALTEEQQKISSQLEEYVVGLKDISKKLLSIEEQNIVLAQKQKSIKNINSRLNIFKRAYNEFLDNTNLDFDIINLEKNNLINVDINNAPLEALAIKISQEIEELEKLQKATTYQQDELIKKQEILNEKLAEPQLAFQKNLKEREEWKKAHEDLIGSSASPETLEGIKAHIVQLDALPTKLGELKTQRLKLTENIFMVLNSQREDRENLFKPVQDLIKSNDLIREEYKLQFQATLNFSVSFFNEKLFSLIKNQIGELRGADESFLVIRKIIDKYDFDTKDSILNFVNEIHAKLESVANTGNSSIGIKKLLRKGIKSSDVYNYIFGLEYLEPRYTLLFQDARIEQLSPGQRGALLLIFYLLVDTGHNPIVLDQPEENLDNQTVVSLLVPVLTEAKKKRQIIMVTHNPNLAVVCDAEQIIYSYFNRKDKSKISYITGAIENPEINIHIVDVLEGTKPAFNNRKGKYHES